jgi:plastocyanin
MRHGMAVAWFASATALLLLAPVTPPAVAASATASNEVALTIVIKDHKFTPAELKVPAGKTIVLTVDNRDATPEEFESTALKIEKIVPGGTSAKVRFGPLKAGSYAFVGDFNDKTARGKLIVE